MLAAVAAWSAGAHAAGCENLASASTPQIQILLAQTVAGSFTPPDGGAALQQLPQFCRVVVRLKPTPDSDIGAEIWLPAKWNTKLLAIGNGGWGGGLDFGSMAAAVRRGYAASVTDDGHTGRGGG